MSGSGTPYVVLSESRSVPVQDYRSLSRHRNPYRCRSIQIIQHSSNAASFTVIALRDNRPHQVPEVVLRGRKHRDDAPFHSAHAQPVKSRPSFPGKISRFE